MNETVQIDDEESLKQFIYKLDALHDAILHEAVILHPGYVDKECRMFGDFKLPNARMIFQSQFADVGAVQINLTQVSRFFFDLKGELQLEGEIGKDEIVLFPLGKAKSNLAEIRATEVEYTLLGTEFLGPEYLLISNL